MTKISNQSSNFTKFCKMYHVTDKVSSTTVFKIKFENSLRLKSYLIGSFFKLNWKLNFCFRFTFFPRRGNLEDPYQSFFYFVNCQNGFDPKLYNFSLKALSFDSYTRFDFMSTQFIHTIFKITPPKIPKFTWI